MVVTEQMPTAKNMLKLPSDARGHPNLR
jgi:hypothetical protein